MEQREDEETGEPPSPEGKLNIQMELGQEVDAGPIPAEAIAGRGSTRQPVQGDQGRQERER